MGKKKKQLMKEFDALDDEQKQEALKFLKYILFRRNIISIEDKYGNKHDVIPLNYLLR